MVEARLKQLIGELSYQNAALAGTLDQANARIRELEERLKIKSEPVSFTIEEKAEEKANG